MAAMNESPSSEMPRRGLEDSEIAINKHQAGPVCENIKPASCVSSCVSMKSDHSMNPPVKFQEPSSIPRVKPALPAASCLSMKSDNSMDPPMKFQSEITQPQRVNPASPAASCLSMKSDNSMEPPMKFQREITQPRRIKPALPAASCLSMKSDNSMDPPMKFQSEITQPQRVKPASPAASCLSMKSDISMEPPMKFQSETTQPQSVKAASPAASCLSNNSMDPPIKFQSETIQLQSVKPASPAASCLSMKSDNSIERPIKFQSETTQLQRCSIFPDQESSLLLKSILKRQFQRLSNGLQRDGSLTLLNDIYTELYITEGGSGEVNNEHEVRQIETASRIHQSVDDKPIKCNDIFKPLQVQDSVIRTVLTKGVAGIGKTVSVQKFILDWAEGKANQDVQFIFPLPFRELNLLKDQCFSLEDLVCHFFPQLKETKFKNYRMHKTVFIFDGLDEYRLPLDFRNTKVVSEVNIPTSVNALLTNLIQENLLSSARVWITSRPAAASQIPHQFISQVTEIRGFDDPQKEEYVRKKISDQSLANDVIKHLKSSRSLYIMCHIPVFCWISSTVLEKMLKDPESKTIPKTLTQMYTHFLIIQTHIREEKYNEFEQSDPKEMIIKLGELAFKQLLKGNLIFYEEDLNECGINVKDAVLYSGICTQIFTEDFELLYSEGKVFCFVHLSIQEHLAALYVHITFNLGNNTVLNQWNPTKCAMTFPCLSLSDLHKHAVDKALQSKSGEFDLFLRFLLGISQESNQSLLQMLLPQISACSSQSVQETIEYIKIRLRMNLSPEKYINLFHCLNELNDFSLEEEIQNFQKSRRLAKTKLSTSQWSALVFVLLTSGNALDVFDLRKYCIDNTNECLQRMLPVVLASRTAEVRNCNLLEKGFQALTSALSSKSSCLRELKLSDSVLHQSGMKILSEGLQSRHCKLEILEMSSCDIQAEDCRPFASAFNSNPSHLRALDLSFNPFGESGIIFLSKVLRDPQCRLEKLKLIGCELNSQSCAYLAAVLNNNSRLVELDLSKNTLKYHGVYHLSKGLGNPSCNLSVLRLSDCGINPGACRSLCNALDLNPSHLSELCLSRNPGIGDTGVQHISDFISKPCCKLEKLSLSFCSVTDNGYTALASALKLNPLQIKELELTGNQRGSSGQGKLLALQQHKDYRLVKLKI
ncbi:NACHT, LRR and PYD domains-containing protein 12-like isoform X3 [Clarias gariepinus]|uniref:NACHT, LRR and PYD domains-containing protein 12-like isoform X3 n=1 Tax=Clarias gariepinus TaxID=13013 RepID=UPI00234DA3EC|nr:NACHT, LRR and PYD domains-containing protein 12-like isoform X3 [Clarias gariepinus]